MSARVKELEVAKGYDAKVGMMGQRKQQVCFHPCIVFLM
jgi:hypothetical protein